MLSPWRIDMENLVIITDIGSTTTKALLLEKNAGRYSIIAMENSPTTVELPDEDVKIGIINAIKKLEKKCGRQLLDKDHNRLFSPGISYFCTSSAGGGLQILVIGLTTFDSAASAKRCAYGAGAVILDTFAINDKRSAVQQMKAMAMLHPDIILMTGGTDGGAVAPVLRLAELIQFANPKAKFTNEPLPLIFAGNVDARDLIEGILAKRFKLHIVDNVRPDLKFENHEPARNLIHQLFMDYVMEQAPGYDKVLKIVDHDIIPTPRAVLLAIELLHRQRAGDVMMVDIGGATTDVFSNLKGKFYRTVSANYGMSYSIANVLKDAGLDFLKHYLPPDTDLDYVTDYIANKMLYPTALPQADYLLFIEHIMARAALFLARQQHLEMNFNTAQIGFLDRISSHKNIENMVDKFYFLDEEKKEKFFLHDYQYAIGAGGVIAHIDNDIQALMLIADGLQTQGLTLIIRDKNFVSPHLGKLSQVDEKIAARLLEESLQNLGWHIRPQTGKWKAGKTVMSILYEDSSLKVIAGKKYVIPASTEKRQFQISLDKKFILNDLEKDITLTTELPLYIDATFAGSENDLSTLKKHYKLDSVLASLSSVFPLETTINTIETGEFIRKIELPYLGDIKVDISSVVKPQDIVAENLSDPPRLYVLTLFKKPFSAFNKENILESLQVKEGDQVKIGEKILIRKKLSVKEQMYGLSDHYASPVRGIIESINLNSGTIILHEIQDYSQKPVTVKISEKLGIKPKHIRGYLKVREGDFVYSGDLLAAIRLDRANRTKSEIADKINIDKGSELSDTHADTSSHNSIIAPATGSITEINIQKGTLSIVYDKNPLLHYAGVNGKIVHLLPQSEVHISYHGWKINGIVGFGRQAMGRLIYCQNLSDIAEPHQDCILILNQHIDHITLDKIAELGYKGLVAPSIHYRHLTKFTGEDIGVALTGNENIPFPIILTQGFGNVHMPPQYQEFFANHNNSHIFIDGHTQIRAGVIRPQIIIQ